MKAANKTKIIATLAGSLIVTVGAMGADPTPAPAVQKVTVRAVAKFDFDQASIHPDDRDKILAEVGQLKDVTWQTVTATGHTDSIGSASYNQKLSERRAQAIKTYLVGKGLDPGMINTAGKASATPVASNNTPAGRSQNRRTEIEFQGVRAPGQ
jgi:OOP family OmpA-OmpF porin